VESKLDYEVELDRIIRFTKAKLLEARAMEVEITKAVEIFNKVGEASSELEYDRAFELLDKCNKKIDTAVDQHIFKIISDCYMEIKKYPKLDFSNVQRYLENANYYLKNKNYQESLDLALRCRNELNEIVFSNIGNYQQQAEAACQEIQSILEQARDEEDLDIKDPEDIFRCMEDSLTSAEGIKDYEDVIEYGAAFKSALARARRRREKVLERIGSAQETLNKMKLALDNITKHFNLPDEINDFHTKSTEAFENHDFEKAEEFADQCAKKLNEITQTNHPDITMEFVTKNLRTDVWNRANILIENKGNAMANNVKLEITGPIQVRRLPVIEELGINEKMELEIGIKFEGAGNVPIDLEIQARRSWDNEQYTIQHELWVDVERPRTPSQDDSQPAGKVELEPQSSGPGQALACLLCKKLIEESTPIINCDCGTIYHLNCSTEMDFCMKCGNNLKKIIPETKEESEVSWE
jgi:tetratricopeptide (TPR) repeat protein